MSNPFEIVSAELMPLAAVGRDFVRNHTEYAKLAAHSHTVVWGSRGSGKSIHFRFLEPLAQAWASETGTSGDVKTYLSQPNAFIGVYVNCREPKLSREEFRRVSDLPNYDADFGHLLFSRHLACAIIDALATTILEQISWMGDLALQSDSVPDGFRRAVAQVPPTLGEFLEHLRSRCSVWLSRLLDIVDDHFLALPRSPDRSHFPREAPSIQDIASLCEFVKATAAVSTPFFLLLDEANELSRPQQSCVNALLACRSQQSLCVKVASQLHGFEPHYRHGGADIDETHDYTTLDLESLYTNHQEAYYQRVRAIATHRLTQANVSSSIEVYLPPNPTDIAAMEHARRIAEERYWALSEDQRPTDKPNFIKKYAPAIVFQEIRSPKASKSYAGFDNVVHLSSGIVRAFLDCCSRMYTKCIEATPEQQPAVIPVSIQNQVIADYSDEFVQAQLVAKIESLEPTLPERAELEALYKLLKALGALFRERLLDSASREPRIISISLKTDPDERLRRILHIAEREAFLHRKWYRSKRGNINLPCYVLNRRLCPHFNLDLSVFQGRLEVSSDDLSIALSDPEAFVTSMRRRSEDTEEQAGQMTLFEW